VLEPQPVPRGAGEVEAGARLARHPVNRDRGLVGHVLGQGVIAGGDDHLGAGLGAFYRLPKVARGGGGARRARACGTGIALRRRGGGRGGRRHRRERGEKSEKGRAGCA